MHPRNTILRKLKFLGKVLLGLILSLFALILLIHVPVVQKKITHSLSEFLSSKMDNRVDIQNIQFSLLGNLTIEGIKVWDPGHNQIISIGTIEATSNIFDLIKGNYNLDKIRIADVTGKLVESDEGLNIQFILDAFRTKETKGTSATAIKLQFKSIILENIVFEFNSIVSGTSIATNLSKFSAENILFSTEPNRIKAEKVDFEQATVMILSNLKPKGVEQPSVSDTNNHLIPDFGLGIDIEINRLNMKESAFAFHSGQVTITPKFDPSHITVKDIQITASNIIMREDTLAARIVPLSAQLPGFLLAKAHVDVQMNRNRIALPGLYLESGSNELFANITGWYDTISGDERNYPNLEGTTTVKINPGDLAYFLSEDMLPYVGQWKNTQLILTGNYVQGKGRLETLELSTANSRIYAAGTINDIWDLEKCSWEDMMVEASIGSDFKEALTPFIGDIKIPPAISLRANSTGNLRKIFLDGNVTTTWGHVKAKGTAIPRASGLSMDMVLIGNSVRAAEWVDLPWLGPIDFSVDVKGMISDDLDAEINGLINSIDIMDQSIHQIAFQSRVMRDSATATISVEDPKYHSRSRIEISFAGPLRINSEFQLDTFMLGTLLQMDSTLSISGNLKSKISIDSSSIEGYVEGKRFLVQNQFAEYLLDSITLAALVSPEASRLEYYAADGHANMAANFDVREVPGIVKPWVKRILNAPESIHPPSGTKTLQFNFQLNSARPLLLTGLEVEDFSAFAMTGDWDEQKQALTLQATSGSFEGYGVSLDTLSANLVAMRDSIVADIHGRDLLYNNFQLGHFDFDIATAGDTAVSNFLLSKDSFSILGLQARILPTDSAVILFPDQIQALGKDFLLDRNSRVYIKGGNLVFDHFLFTSDDKLLRLDGDLKAFDVNFKNLDLTSLNILLSPDSTIIDHGDLTGIISYVSNEKLDLNAQVDSLILNHSVPLAITLSALTDENRIPFQFLLSNESNKVGIDGQYFLDTKEVDAAFLLDVNNLDFFSFLTSGVLDDMKGTVKGEAKIRGRIPKPEIKGSLRFLDAHFTTANPKFTFYVQDDIITVDSSKFSVDHFTIYDRGHHPLTIDGYLAIRDFESFMYDLNIITAEYTLLDIPGASKDELTGLLVIATDIVLKGDEKDTYVKADMTIKDTTHLTYVLASEDVDLLKAEGIVEFVDPGQLLDSAGLEQPVSFYDSLITSLPEFNLHSTITIEDNAKLKVITNAQSGDFFEASGGAKLELDYDRTGNAHLAGNYTIKQGIYRVSFYDLVKKNFQFVPGSSISWSGSPETGDLDIKAVYTVASNSIGLIGHEVGENEKSAYKRSLDYEVGVNIKGTIDKPIVSFSLDLPAEEKTNYPVLANKLDRLKLPEFQTELNKQVFGLLVLGGFLPDASDSDINSNQIATTALYNSVNSILAGQLNRFAGQYIKGVNIDVGIQSYSDYATPGGKTQTAMDFRVSKSILDDRLSFEVGGDFDIATDQSSSNKGDNYRGDVAIIYDLAGNGDKLLKLFNNETYDIVYQEIRNTGISLVFIREFDKGDKVKNKKK